MAALGIVEFGRVPQDCYAFIQKHQHVYKAKVASYKAMSAFCM